jgi:hypothetical protein
MPRQGMSANGAAGQLMLDAQDTDARRATSFPNSPTNKPVMPRVILSANGAAGQMISDAQGIHARRATLSF